MRRFASKLLRGEHVTVSVAGGSISRGYADSDRIEEQYMGYFGRFVHWLTESWPGQVTNGQGAIGCVLVLLLRAQPVASLLRYGPKHAERHAAHVHFKPW